MREAGVDTQLEQMIRDDLAAALAYLEGAGLSPAGVEGLRETALAIAWRES